MSDAYRDYAVSPVNRSFGPGWTITLPRGIDRTTDRIVIRLYADAPSPTADGWEGIWIQPPATGAVESFRSPEKDAVVEWAKATGVRQIIVEDESTRTFQAL